MQVVEEESRHTSTGEYTLTYQVNSNPCLLWSPAVPLKSDSAVVVAVQLTADSAVVVAEQLTADFAVVGAVVLGFHM